MAENQSTPFDFEVWKPVPHYEGMYEVSNLGRVRGLDRIGADGRRLKGKVLKQAENASGYQVTTLCRNGVSKTFLTHRLVWLAFHGPVEAGLQIDHLDNDPGNPSLRNLEKVTPKENTRRQKKFGTHISHRVQRQEHHQTRKTHCPIGHPLGGINNLPSLERKGRRGCLACNRAYCYIRWNPSYRPHFKKIADSYYKQIIDKQESK